MDGFSWAMQVARSDRLPDPFAWKGLRLGPVADGAYLGAYSHILLDSVMHSDIRPLAPFSDAKPLYRAVILGELHESCLLAGAVAILVLAVRRLVQRRRAG